MTARISTSLLVPALVALFGTSPAAGQEPAPGSRVAVLEAPLALRLDHKSLREALNRALEDKAGVGDAARAIDALLSSHFKHEEALALRPLGLLRGVARDASSADIASAIAMTVKIEKDLPQLLDEHRAILEASKRLGDVARRERKPQFLDLADRLWLHTRIAEEVLYPAAILLGEHLRVTHGSEAATQVTEAVMNAMKTSARLLMLAALAAFTAAPASAQTPERRPPNRMPMASRSSRPTAPAAMASPAAATGPSRSSFEPGPPISHRSRSATRARFRRSGCYRADRRPAGREAARRVADAGLGGRVREVRHRVRRARDRRSTAFFRFRPGGGRRGGCGGAARAAAVSRPGSGAAADWAQRSRSRRSGVAAISSDGVRFALDIAVPPASTCARRGASAQAAEAESSGDLLAAQRLERIETRRPPRRQVAGGERHQREERPARRRRSAGSVPEICATMPARTNLPTAQAPPRPMARPMASCHRPRRSTSQPTAPRPAPSAIRTPISCVRVDTE